MQDKVESPEDRFRKFIEYMTETTATTDKNDLEKCSSIGKIIHEQEDVRRLVEELARRLDHTQETDGETHSESNVAM